jgi:polysaccharide export outer membrane protein
MSSLTASILLVLAQAAATPSAATGYQVGPGDLLEVTVEGRADLSRLATVQTTGSIYLPRAGEVSVQGLTTGQIESTVAPLLVGEDLPTPKVAVTLRGYQSQFVWVYGEVLRPGRKTLRAGSRLIDALLDAGGFTTRASGEVTIERRNGTFPNGRPSLAVAFSGGSPSPEELQLLSLPLVSGDKIVAATQHWVLVSGEITRPGRYPLDGRLTLSQLVDEAGGLTPFGSERVTLRRGDASGAGGEQEVDLDAVRSGEAVDPELAPGDHVVVKARRL